MEKKKLEDLRDRVPCAAVLEQTGFAVDLEESTRRALKYRRGAEIVIVIHEGRGWFDPLSDAKGDVFSLTASTILFLAKAEKRTAVTQPNRHETQPLIPPG